MSSQLNRVKKSIAFFMIFLLISIVGLCGRIAWIQFVQGANLAKKADARVKSDKVLQSPRGTIYDRNGHELAISSLAKSLAVDPKMLNIDPGELASLLAPVLGMTVEDIRESLVAPGRFAWIKRELDQTEVDQVDALIKANKIVGLVYRSESKRYYPNNRLASHVLGFVGTDDKGLGGIEQVYDSLIKGVITSQTLDTDRDGTPIFQSILKFATSKQEKSVYLTIDSMIQFIVEQSLDKAMVQTKAKGATVIVMNTKTGEILAMASRPNYDPNKFFQYSEEARRNRAVSAIYEPGSTFKSIVAGAALQEKVVSPAERFVDNGYVELAGGRIKNWSGDAYGPVTFTDIVKYSINTGFVQVGMRLGKARLTNYTREFGFGKPTDIELPGEQKGILYPDNMQDMDLATMSIGQGLAVTPLQLITAVSAIANNGVLLKPHIVKEIHNADGSIDTAIPTERIRQVITPETASELKGLLEKVVSEGGGKRAQVKGYHFAGKTGTAEKLNDTGSGYESGHYIASFVGFGPVEDAQIAALVVIEDPQGMYYGGEIAAPIFSEIMTQIVRYLGIRPQTDAPPAIPQQTQNITVVPSVPVAPKTVPPGKALVPNVLGKSIRDAGDAASSAGLYFVPVGTGVAVSQNIAPNTLVDAQTELTVTFAPR